MKALVHIGTPKTGTTSAQSWLSKNREFLAERGILYPKSLGAQHHIKLSTACRSPERPERGFKLYNIRSHEDHGKFVRETKSLFKEEISSGVDYKYCIISSEWLYDRLTTEDEILNLKNFLDEHFEEIDLLVWVRPQVDYILSFASTVSRTGDVFNAQKLEGICSNEQTNYNNVLKKWESVFDVGSVRVESYKRAPYIVEYLMRYCNVNDVLPEVKSRKNSKLGINIINLSNQIRLRHANVESEPGWKRRDYLQAIQSNESLVIDRECAAKIHAAFSCGNSELISRHGSLQAGDLEPDWDKFADDDNLASLQAPCSFSSELTQLVGLMEAERKLQQSLTEIARAEISLLRGENPDDHIRMAKKLIDAANQGPALSSSVARAQRKLQLVVGMEPIVRNGIRKVVFHAKKLVGSLN